MVVGDLVSTAEQSLWHLEVYPVPSDVVVASVFVIAPLAGDSELTGFGKVISSAYPVVDVLLIAVIVRMWTAPGARTASYRLLVSALGLTLAGDLIWDVVTVAGGTGRTAGSISCTWPVTS